MKRIVNSKTTDEYGIVTYKLVRVCPCASGEVLTVGLVIAPLDYERRWATAQLLRSARQELQQEYADHLRRRG